MMEPIENLTHMPSKSSDVQEDANLDKDLQNAYQEALALLDNGRYHAAREILLGLQKKARGHLVVDISHSLEEAQSKLTIQVRTCSDKALGYAKRQPNDFQGQRKLWDEVLTVEPNNKVAQQALHHIDVAEQTQKTVSEISRLRENGENALSALRLLDLNRILGQAEALQQNDNGELQRELEELVQQISHQRDQLRIQLGSASTLSVSGNQREAYRQAQDYLARGIALVFDTAGVFGQVGAEVDTYRFLQEARLRFLASLHDLAQQRLSLASSQKERSPAKALEILKDARQLLRDENPNDKNHKPILTKEDRDELQGALKFVEQELNEVEYRLARFEAARANILQADTPNISVEKKYQLYCTARELYPDYPKINDYIESTKSHLESLAIGYLHDQLVRAKFLEEQNNFDEALELLQTVRREVLVQFSASTQSNLKSQLEKALQESEELQGKILIAGRDYRKFAEIDALFNNYEQQKKSSILFNIKTHLEPLAHLRQAKKYHQRLTELENNRKIEDAQKAKDERKFAEMFALLATVKSPNHAIEASGLALDALNDFVIEVIEEAHRANKKFQFAHAEEILKQAKKRILDWANELSISPNIQNIDILLNETSYYRKALQELREAEDCLNENQAMDLLEKSLQAPRYYQTSISDSLKSQARNLLTKQSLRQVNRKDYEKRLFELLLENPLNNEVRIRYEWLQKQNWIIDLIYQSKMWFWSSIITALILLGTSVAIIIFSFSQNNPLDILINSLTSLIPVLATKLVYDQAAIAHNRIEEARKNLESEKITKE